MEHLAIDLGGRESHMCVRSHDGHIVEERRCPTSALPRYLATRPRSRVVVETCSEAFGVADAALAVGCARRAGDVGALVGRGSQAVENGSTRCADPQRGVVPDRPAVGPCTQSRIPNGRRCVGCGKASSVLARNW
jgi:hypothetical protein